MPFWSSRFSSLHLQCQCNVVLLVALASLMPRTALDQATAIRQKELAECNAYDELKTAKEEKISEGQEQIDSKTQKFATPDVAELLSSVSPASWTASTRLLLPCRLAQRNKSFETNVAVTCGIIEMLKGLRLIQRRPHRT